MNLEWFSEFEDPYFRGPCGQGYFLAGVVLGMLAHHQARQMNTSIGDAPLFKSIQLGRVDRYSLKRQLSRVATLMNAYGFGDERLLNISREAMELIMKCGKDMGVDGNFVFSLGFIGAPDYYYNKIFPKKNIEKEGE